MGSVELFRFFVIFAFFRGYLLPYTVDERIQFLWTLETEDEHEILATADSH
jgi:hypothetical protein